MPLVAPQSHRNAASLVGPPERRPEIALGLRGEGIGQHPIRPIVPTHFGTPDAIGGREGGFGESYGVVAGTRSDSRCPEMVGLDCLTAQAAIIFS